jgi:26S proteasome regulatory subunit N2
MGLALISYGIEEAADTLIEQMAREQDPILRYGAMYVLGMAYRCACCSMERRGWGWEAE